MQELSLGARRLRAIAALFAFAILTVQIFREDGSEPSHSDFESAADLGSFFVSHSVDRPKFAVDSEFFHNVSLSTTKHTHQLICRICSLYICWTWRSNNCAEAASLCSTIRTAPCSLSGRSISGSVMGSSECAGCSFCWSSWIY